MKLQLFFTQLWRQARIGAARFLAAFVCSLCLFATLAWELFAPQSSAWMQHAVLAFLLGIAAGVCWRLALERFCAQVSRWLALLVPLGVSALCFAGLHLWADSPYAIMAFFGICAALAFGSLALLYTRERESVLFGALIKALIFSGFVTLVLMLGLFLCLAAFTALLHEFDSVGKLYTLLAEFLWSVLFVNLFLAQLPQKEELPSVPKVYTTLTGYVALPVYLLLLLILYGYCFKILFTLQLPQGEMNWFASFALLFYVLFYLGLRMQQSKVSQFFVRWGGALLVPVVAVQCLCIGIRLSAYGLTPVRWLSLACLLFGIFAIAHSFTRLSLQKLMLSGAVLALLVTATPLNALDVAQWNQAGRLKAVLRANGMYDGSVITQASQPVTDEDRARISSCYDYLHASRANKSEFVLAATDGSFTELYGLDYEGDGDGEASPTQYLYFRADDTSAPFDVKEYRWLYDQVEVSPEEAELTLQRTDGASYTCSILPYCKTLYAEYGENPPDTLAMTYAPDADTLVVFRFLELDLSGGDIISVYADCYLLQK